MDNVWTFQFVDETDKTVISSGVNDVLGSGTKAEKKTTTSKKNFSDTFSKKIESSIESTVLSPLNTATGGLASPTYKAIKSLSQGKSTANTLGMFAGAVGVLALQAGLNALEKRVEEINTKVNELNNTDNTLIRAGAVSKTTYYTGNIFGVKSTTNRS